ncbi:MAG TPA: COX15/CtaA family protein [Longimicrobiales bacterium]|nr:COX15/CtaA family protein [Longimicrobiales bacterium]
MSTTASFAPEAAPPAPPADWRRAIPEPRRRLMRGWLWSIAAMTLGVLIVGGITRLTRSGLSIVDWEPLMGVIPPLTEGQWLEAFERYRQFPEYQKVRAGMSLSEFKFIFFWEYMHRLLGRTIGLVFLVPFAVFAVRRWFNRPLAWRALLLFTLGAMQGVMGWLMVASGLVDRPSVSHYRLAAHLSLAFIIFGYAVWLARELRVGATRVEVPARARRVLAWGLGVVGALLAAQIVWGAFVAGLRAGFFHNTFPLMAGRLVPVDLLALEPALRNFVENPVTVQWTHRVLGTLLLIATGALAWAAPRSGADPRSRRYGAALLALLAAQYLLGVVTLLLAVPVALGVAHQAMAMVLVGVWLVWVHHTRETRAQA